MVVFVRFDSIFEVNFERTDFFGPLHQDPLVLGSLLKVFGNNFGICRGRDYFGLEVPVSQKAEDLVIEETLGLPDVVDGFCFALNVGTNNSCLRGNFLHFLLRLDIILFRIGVPKVIILDWGCEVQVRSFLADLSEPNHQTSFRSHIVIVVVGHEKDVVKGSVLVELVDFENLVQRQPEIGHLQILDFSLEPIISVVVAIQWQQIPYDD